MVKSEGKRDEGRRAYAAGSHVPRLVGVRHQLGNRRLVPEGALGRRCRLKSCVWELTLNCCFSCKYCGSRAGENRDNELTTEECLDIVNQLSELGCKRVSLIGGEVFMRNDWDIIADSLTAKNIRTAIITNGYIMSDELINKLIQTHIESVAVSLDSIEPIHDKYRQIGSFSRAEESIRILTNNNIPTAVISTLNSENIDYLEDFYAYIQRWPLYAWQLQACAPMGNASEGIPYRFDFNKAIRFVMAKKLTAPFNIGIADNIGYFTEGEGYLRGNNSGYAIFRGCRAGISSIGIDSSGNVRGCESMYDECFNEGNLREQSLREIWESPTAFSYNRIFSLDKLSGKCIKCKYSAYCQGGCRSYNWFVNGNLYESPFCALRSEKVGDS